MKLEEEIKSENDLVILDEEYVKDKTYIIRGKKVMIDSDLAEIYGYSTKDFNRQVKNNIDRFDERFMFKSGIIIVSWQFDIICPTISTRS